jgi:4-amino-4-deoxy-L-arabinose transferase-like glycosyltransferase
MKSIFFGEKKAVVLGLVLILLMGAFLRFYRLGNQSLWTDEISGTLIAGSNLSEIFSRNLSPDKADIPVEEPPLQYFLMHYSLRLSENEFMARLPSAFFGILSILAIFLVARLFFGNSTALVSSFLLSISFYHILYSQEARGYSAHLLFSLLSLFFIWKAANRGGIRNWIGFSVATTLNIYSHYSAFQVFAVESLIFVLLLCCFKHQISFPPSNRERIIGYSLSTFVTGVLSLPLLGNFLQVMNSRLGGTTIAFELNPQYFANLLARYGAGNGVAFYVYNVFFLLGVIWAFVSNRKKESAAAILWLIFPFVVLTITGYKYFFHIRYVMFTFPIYLVMVANGLVGTFQSKVFKDIVQRSFFWDWKWAGWIYGAACLSVLGAFSIAPLNLYYRMPARMTDWKGIAAYIKENYESGTLILIESSFCVRELGYYLKDAKPRIKVESVNGDINRFKTTVSQFDRVWYVDSNPVFDSIVLDLFKDRITFASPVFAELGRRELIDWDGSWFPASNIRRYYPTLYYNNVHHNKNLSVDLRQR